MPPAGASVSQPSATRRQRGFPPPSTLIPPDTTMRTLRFLALALTASALAACSDGSTGPSGPPVLDAAAARANQAALDDWFAGDPAVASVFRFGAIASVVGSGTAALPARLLGGLARNLAAGTTGAPRRAAGAAPEAVIIEPQRYGQTFVFDTTTWEWVVDAHAPALGFHGVRVMVYADGDAASQQVVGYVDFIDDTPPTANQYAVDMTARVYSGASPATARRVAQFSYAYAETRYADGSSKWSERSDGSVTIGGETATMSASFGEECGLECDEGNWRADLRFDASFARFAATYSEVEEWVEDSSGHYRGEDRYVYTVSHDGQLARESGVSGTRYEGAAWISTDSSEVRVNNQVVAYSDRYAPSLRAPDGSPASATLQDYVSAFRDLADDAWYASNLNVRLSQYLAGAGFDYYYQD